MYMIFLGKKGAIDHMTEKVEISHFLLETIRQLFGCNIISYRDDFDARIYSRIEEQACFLLPCSS
jgi:hypothetical protein